MGGTVLIPSNDPGPLIAAFAAKARTPADQAKVAGELSALLAALDSGTTGHTDLLNFMVDFDTAYTKESTGHGALDHVNIGLDALKIYKLEGDAISTVQKAVDTDKLYSLGQGPARRRPHRARRRIHPTTIGYGILAQEIVTIMSQLAHVPFGTPDGASHTGDIHVDFERLIAQDSLITDPSKLLDETLKTIAEIMKRVDFVELLLRKV